MVYKTFIAMFIILLSFCMANAQNYQKLKSPQNCMLILQKNDALQNEIKVLQKMFSVEDAGLFYVLKTSDNQSLLSISDEIKSRLKINGVYYCTVENESLSSVISKMPQMKNYTISVQYFLSQVLKAIDKMPEIIQKNNKKFKVDKERLRQDVIQIAKNIEKQYYIKFSYLDSVYIDESKDYISLIIEALQSIYQMSITIESIKDIMKELESFK